MDLSPSISYTTHYVIYLLHVQKEFSQICRSCNCFWSYFFTIYFIMLWKDLSICFLVINCLLNLFSCTFKIDFFAFFKLIFIIRLLNYYRLLFIIVYPDSRLLGLQSTYYLVSCFEMTICFWFKYFILYFDDNFKHAFRPLNNQAFGPKAKNSTSANPINFMYTLNCPNHHLFLFYLTHFSSYLHSSNLYHTTNYPFPLSPHLKSSNQLALFLHALLFLYPIFSFQNQNQKNSLFYPLKNSLFFLFSNKRRIMFALFFCKINYFRIQYTYCM